jgi:hypothetical protein
MKHRIQIDTREPVYIGFWLKDNAQRDQSLL